MTQISSAFTAYINVNILLVLAFSLWLFIRFLLNRFGMKHAYQTKLRLLNGIFLAILASPFIALGYNRLAAGGMLPDALTFNLSDFMLSQYLNGRIGLQAGEMQQVLDMRETLETNLLNPTGWISQIIVALLLIGSVLCVLRCGHGTFKLRRIIASSYAWRRFGNVHLRLTDQSVVPFSARGFRRRYIVIPANMLVRRQDMRIALAHEFQHLRQHDVEWEIGFELFKSLFFWNPVIHFWKRQIEQLRELSCDQQILKRRWVDARAYCECLLRVCEDTMRRQPAQAISLPRVSLVQFDRSWLFPSRLNLLRRRVDSALTAAATPAKAPLAYLLIVPLGLLLIWATIAIQRPQSWTHDRLMLSSIVNLERLEALNGNTH